MADFQTPGEYFKQRDCRPRKHLGQHFLSQPGTALKIVQSAELAAGEAVVEIGPGLGALTRFIMEQTEKIHLIEVDAGNGRIFA